MAGEGDVFEPAREMSFSAHAVGAAIDLEPAGMSRHIAPRAGCLRGSDLPGGPGHSIFRRRVVSSKRLADGRTDHSPRCLQTIGDFIDRWS